VYGEQEMSYKSMSAGSYFGEVELFTQTSRQHSIMVAENADIFAMNKANFNEMIENFPDTSEEIKKIAIMRAKINAKAKL
jgi:CRP-like cAMP-binding protein